MKARVQNKNFRFQTSRVTHDVGQANLLLLACASCRVPGVRLTGSVGTA